VVHFEEGGSNNFGFFAVVEEAGEFGFGGACHDVAKDAADDEDCAIDWGHWVFVSDWHVLRHVA